MAPNRHVDYQAIVERRRRDRMINVALMIVLALTAAAIAWLVWG